MLAAPTISSAHISSASKEPHKELQQWQNHGKTLLLKVSTSVNTRFKRPAVPSRASAGAAEQILHPRRSSVVAGSPPLGLDTAGSPIVYGPQLLRHAWDEHIGSCFTRRTRKHGPSLQARCCASFSAPAFTRRAAGAAL